jgi:hypothetical protein
MKAYWGVAVWLHAFLTLALDGGEWSASRPGLFAPRERAPVSHRIGGWMGSRAGLDAPVGTRTPDHSVHSPALYHWAIQTFPESDRSIFTTLYKLLSFSALKWRLLLLLRKINVVYCWKNYSWPVLTRDSWICLHEPRAAMKVLIGITNDKKIK